MIKGTIIQAMCNSGATKLRIFGFAKKNQPNVTEKRLLSRRTKGLFSVGTRVKCSVREMAKKKNIKVLKVQKGDVVDALIVRSKRNEYYREGFHVRFFQNSALLLQANNTVMGTAFKGIGSTKCKLTISAMKLFKEVI